MTNIEAQALALSRRLVSTCAPDSKYLATWRVNFFPHSLDILHLRLLGRAAKRGQANISLRDRVVYDDPDVRACLRNFPD